LTKSGKIDEIGDLSLGCLALSWGGAAGTLLANRTGLPEMALTDMNEAEAGEGIPVEECIVREVQKHASLPPRQKGSGN
jgi:hypothetical protein